MDLKYKIFIDGAPFKGVIREGDLHLIPIACGRCARYAGCKKLETSSHSDIALDCGEFQPK